MRVKIVLAAWCVLVFCAAGPASAQTIMKQCSEAYRAAKAANQLNGEGWPQFLSHCSAEKSAQTETPATPASAPASPPAASAAPAVTPAGPVVATPVVATPSAASATTTTLLVAAVGTSRQKQCGSEWRANKATLKAQYGTWPKYWSACNKRLKADGK